MGRTINLLGLLLLAVGAPACVDSALVTDDACGFDGDCPTGSRCRPDGACEVCPAGQVACHGLCVDLAADPHNCGACDTSCEASLTCLAGSCACTEPGSADCGDGCLPRASDDTNCGGCGNACVPGMHCRGGACACAAWEEPCALGGCCSLRILVPAGTLVAGCDGATDPLCPAGETRGEAILDAFLLERTETSIEEYAACVAVQACPRPFYLDLFQTEAFPEGPAHLRYDEAVAYCAWRGGRLPTGLEWQRAARGVDGRTYPWGEEPPDCERATYGTCLAQGETLPVESHLSSASPDGFLNTAGNVLEWIDDDRDVTAECATMAPPPELEYLLTGECKLAAGGGVLYPVELLRAYMVGIQDTGVGAGAARCAYAPP